MDRDAKKRENGLGRLPLKASAKDGEPAEYLLLLAAEPLPGALDRRPHAAMPLGQVAQLTFQQVQALPQFFGYFCQGKQFHPAGG